MKGATKSVIEVGNVVKTGNWESPQRGRIYSTLGLAPALNTCGGGGLEPKIVLAYERRNHCNRDAERSDISKKAETLP